MTITADKLTPGKTGTDVVYADGQVHLVPAWAASDPSLVRLRSSQLYWNVNAAFGRDVADRMQTADLTPEEVSRVLDWLDWLCRYLEASE